MAMEVHKEDLSTSQGESQNSSKSSIDEKVKQKVYTLGKCRKSYPAKCSNMLHEIFKLRVEAVADAKVLLKLPSNARREAIIEIEKQYAKHSSEGMDDSNSSLDTRGQMCNEPSPEEAAMCEVQLENLEQQAHHLHTALSQVQMEGTSVIYKMLRG